jgi:hypothetical protein
MVEVVEVDVTEVVDSVAAEVEDAAEVSDTEYPSVHRLMGLITKNEYPTCFLSHRLIS